MNVDLAYTVAGSKVVIATERHVSDARTRSRPSCFLSDLAFAGLARQAELVRERRGVRARTGRALLAPDRALRPAAERVRRRLRRAGARSRRTTPRPGPLSGVPIAVKDEMDIAGEVTSHGTQAFDPPATAGLRGRAPAARGRRDRGRQDEDARARAVAVHGVDHVGRDAQPVGHGPHARRFERRLGGRGRRGAGAGRGRRRRRRLDPDPGRLLRAVRAQAAHGAGPADAARRRRQPLGLLRRPHPLGQATPR